MALTVLEIKDKNLALNLEGMMNGSVEEFLGYRCA